MDKKITKINHEVVKRNNEIYNRAAAKYGLTSSSVLWDDPQTQYFRFYELVKCIDLDDKNISILDVGCGNGELYKFLNFLGFRGEYVGCDINLSLIKQSKKRFKGIQFFHADIMEGQIKRKFDYVLTSGLFNTNAGQSVEWINNFLKKMLSLSKRAVIFNAISSYVNYKEKSLYYLSPGEIMDFAIKNLSPRITIAHHNLPYNYSVVIFKDKGWRSINK
jgi:SAM-dependent methyltransferase